jgi:hypothetical protein
MPRDTMSRERIIEVRREDANEYYLVRLDPSDVGELEGKGIGERKDSHFVS